MSDQDKSKEQLVEELADLRRRLAVQEAQIARSQEAAADQRRIHDNLPVVLATAGVDGYYKQVNAAFERILGWSEEESLSRSYMEFIHPDDRAAAAQTLEQLKAGDPAINFVDRTFCKDGSYRWFNWVVIPVLHRDVVFGIGQDITEQKRAEEASRESQHRYRLLADSTPDVIYILDEAGKLLYANRAAGMYYGVNPESLVGKTQHDLFPPDKAKIHLERIQHVFQTGHIGDREERYQFGDRDVWLNVRTIPLRDEQGRVTSLMGVCRDITARKQAEEAIKKAYDELEERVNQRTAQLTAANELLRQSHDELEVVYDSVVDGLLVTDIETLRFQRANAAICRMLGYSEAELLALTLDDIHPAEALPAILDHIRSLTATSDQTPTGQIPLLRKDGNVFHAEVIGKFLVYDGRPCSMGIFRDITERLQAEEALERERQSLWRMLQASDHERQIIAYDIHDGLAQYLAAAGMQFQVYDSLKESSPADARKAYETAVQLVHQAHAESRRLISEVRHPVIDERGLESAILSLVYEQRQRGGPRIECHTSVEFDRLPPILENAIYRMVQEALTNACRHSKSKNVAVRLVQEGRDVRLEVQDWGVGFDTEAVDKDRFGLESIRQRARLLGGRLTIESKPNAGTLVRVIVPILERQTDD